MLIYLKFEPNEIYLFGYAPGVLALRPMKWAQGPSAINPKAYLDTTNHILTLVYGPSFEISRRKRSLIRKQFESSPNILI